MHWIVLFGYLKLWVPSFGGLYLAFKLYTSVSHGVSEWANTLLDNHMKHIQDASERIANSMDLMATDHRESLELQRDLVHEIREQRNDIRVLGTKIGS